jgi:hypothetical protein
MDEDILEDKEYFAEKDASEIGACIIDRKNKYYQHMDERGFLGLLRRMYIKYFRGLVHKGQILEDGEQGEFSILYVNQLRNILRNIFTLATNTPPYYEPQASNSDYSSQAVTILAKGLLDYYSKVKNMSRHIKIAAENAICYGEGFIITEWDTWAGDDYIPDEEGNLIKEGDIKYSHATPIDMIRDISAKGSDQNWYIYRKFVNKRELARRFPEKSEQIKNSSYAPDRDYLDVIMETGKSEDSDYIPIYTLYHERTENVPNGRLTTCLESGDVLFDSPLPYKSIPITRITTGNIDESIFGYTVGFDLLPIQEMIDVLVSTVATNQKNLGVIDILVPAGSNMKMTQIAPGMNTFNYQPNGTAKPEVFEKLKTATEIFSFIKDLVVYMEQISGINAAVRGNPPPGLTAGVSIALLSSNAIQFSQTYEESYAQANEDVATKTVELLQTFAETERVIEIVGKFDSVLTKSFKAEDLDGIQRVTVSMGNPMTRTTAGRLNLVAELQKLGFITSPEQYMQVLETGRYEPSFEAARMENLTIRQENEKLMEASNKGVVAFLTDKHLQHINEHKGVLASTSARENPEVVRIVLAHIQEHLDILMDPKLVPFLNALGQQSLAPMMPLPQPPPPQGVNDPSAQPGQSMMPQGMNGVDVRSLNTLKNPVTDQPLDIQPQI